MIGRLKGTVAEKGPEGVLLDVTGVGYEVHCPLTVIDRLPPRGQDTSLAIHTYVREDQLTLFGFSDVEERALFRQLHRVVLLLERRRTPTDRRRLIPKLPKRRRSQPDLE